MIWIRIDEQEIHDWLKGDIPELLKKEGNQEAWNICLEVGEY